MMNLSSLKGRPARLARPLAALALLVAAAGTAQAQTYSNGGFSTGNTSKSGVTAPTGSTWSEVQNDAGVTTASNTNAGYTANKASNSTLADDFTVAPSQSLTLNTVSVFAYQSGYTGTTSPFTELYVRIWNGRPGTTGASVVYGDLTTNRLLTTTDANAYRIFNSLYPTPTAPVTTRHIWQVTAAVTPALTLGPGTYWVEWTSTTSGGLSHFHVPVTVAGLRQSPGGNAIQLMPGQSTYTPALDEGNPNSAPDVTVDFPFVLNAPVPAPVLSTLSPANGVVGTSVTLTGTNLTGATGVRFNGTAASTFAVVNATTVTATVPAGASSGLVTVTTPGGTSNGLAFVVSPPTNNALAFDGTNDYVNLGTPASLNFGTGDFTVEVWLRNDQPSSVGYTLALGTLNLSGTNLWLGAKNGHAALGLSSTDFETNVSIADGRWHHVAAARTAGTLVIYVDGVAALTQPSPQNLNTGNPFLLGNYSTDPFATNFYWRGSLDEVRLYNAGLSQAQVQADMFSTTSALPASQKAYFNFDQGLAGGNNAGITTLPDLNGTGNNGTLTNFALSGTASNWVRSFPTITGISPNIGVAGTSVSITGTNLTDATGFAFNGTATTGFATPTSDLAATVAVPVGASTGPVSVSSATLTAYNGPVFTVGYPDVVINTPGQSIAAGTYNSITVNSGGTGTLAGPVTVNSFVTVNNGGTLNTNCQALTGSSGFTLAAGGTLGICSAQGITASGATGAVQVTGPRNFSPDASYVYNGTVAQVTGNGLPAQVRNLTSTNSSALTLSQAVSVAQVLTLNTGNLNLSGRVLTLLSNASGTALVANLGSGFINGTTVTVQRYIDDSLNPGLGYRHLAAPVAGATVAAFGSGGTTPVVNNVYNLAADPGSVNPFPTIYRYDQSRLATSPATTLSAFDKGWVSPVALGDAAPLATTGFTVQLPGASTLSFTGQVGNGFGGITLGRNSGATAADAGLNLIGNPYPSPLDFSTITAAQRNNMDAAFYVFESNSQYGGNYRTYINGAGVSSLVGTAQAFFVRVTAGQTSGSLTLDNSNRITTYAQQAPVRRTAETRPLVQLDLQGANGLADAFIAYAESGATAGFDGEYDAPKLTNSSGLNLSSTATTGERLAIEGRPEFLASTVLPLQVGVPAAGTYTLTAAQLLNLPAGLDAYLRDAQTGQVVNLRTQPSYAFTVSNASALITGRFELVFSAQGVLATAPAALAAQVAVYPNPATATAFVELPAALGRTAVAAELVDALGRAVQTLSLPAQGAAAHRLDLAKLATGVYALHLKTSAGVIVKKLVVQ
ncbi:LamG-like jellyroll fold domain-containing protein [Hymenobacter ruricola]|uniref:IPT/TIG domain-containing protein n=1 Tax=Hymenobacter ruricola TaxID=2791023 RepID=A0ABS0I3F3_9BACT|nr:LamG-like jellyroll fold domain-containing protein [Hymenobacter ruricola]MBF9221452.1 IPT/TIG domain-containing protein [Hymenobacter ruricola]